MTPILLRSAQSAICCLVTFTVLANEPQRYYAESVNHKGQRWTADLMLVDNKVSGKLTVINNGVLLDGIKCSRAKVKKGNSYKMWCRRNSASDRVEAILKGDFEYAKTISKKRGGPAEFRFLTGDSLGRYLEARAENPSLTTDQFEQ